MNAKKILFVRPTMGVGGADRVTLLILRYLDRAQYQPELALMRSEGKLLNDVPADVPIHNCNASSLWSMPRPLYEVLKKGNYDIVYATCGGASIPLLIAVRQLKKKPLVVVSERNILVHPGKSPIKRWLMNRLKRSLYRNADWVTVVSKALGQEVQSLLKVDGTKIRVVHNPVIDQELHQRKKEAVSHPFFTENDSFVLLAVGRLVYQKDYPTLISAFETVHQQHQQARLLVLGDGPQLVQLKEQVRKYGLANKVDFLGFDRNPFRYMNNCDVFVLSSKHEGMPGVLVQAMACGAACVSTDCPTGPNEIIQSGKNGLLTPVENPEALASAITKLMTDTALHKQCKANAPSAVNRFKIAPALDSYFEFIPST